MSLGSYQEWIAERQRLLGRINELEAENTKLKKRLGEDVVPVVQKPTAMQKLSAQEKVELFRNVFKGREDVFAKRWYSKASGKGGYQPVCQNEWGPLCDKRKFKCADCPSTRHLALFPAQIYRMSILHFLVDVKMQLPHYFRRRMLLIGLRKRRITVGQYPFILVAYYARISKKPSMLWQRIALVYSQRQLPLERRWLP